MKAHLMKTTPLSIPHYWKIRDNTRCECPGLSPGCVNLVSNVGEIRFDYRGLELLRMSTHIQGLQLRIRTSAHRYGWDE